MQNLFKKFQKQKEQLPKVSEVYINNQHVIITPITYEEQLEVVFLILPYLKLVKVIKEEYKSTITADIFFDVVTSLIQQLSREDLNKALQILIKKDKEFVSNLTSQDLLKMMPLIIRENNIIDIFFAMRSLGAFE